MSDRKGWYHPRAAWRWLAVGAVAALREARRLIGLPSNPKTNAKGDVEGNEAP